MIGAVLLAGALITPAMHLPSRADPRAPYREIAACFDIGGQAIYWPRTHALTCETTTD